MRSQNQEKNQSRKQIESMDRNTQLCDPRKLFINFVISVDFREEEDFKPV